MSDDQPPFHNPFGALAGLRGRQPASRAAGPKPAARGRRLHPETKTYPRAVVRMERSGRGGKEVTVVEQLAMSPAEREAWLKALKAALGCGGTVEGDAFMLQGDHRKRLPALLVSRGVKKVIIG